MPTEQGAMPTEQQHDTVTVRGRRAQGGGKPWLTGLRPTYSLLSDVPELKSGVSPRFGTVEMHRPAPVLTASKRPKPQPKRSLWGRARSNFGVGPTKTAAEWTSALKPAIVNYKATDLTKEVEEIVASGMVVTEHERDAKATAFWKQGDTSLNTYEVMRQRLKLRHSPIVIAALLAWWETALRSEGIDDPEGRTDLGKEGHIRCLTMLFSGLIEGWDAASASGRQELEKAWHEDSKGGDSLRRDDFFDALFELTECAPARPPTTIAPPLTAHPQRLHAMSCGF